MDVIWTYRINRISSLLVKIFDDKLEKIENVYRHKINKEISNRQNWREKSKKKLSPKKMTQIIS